MNGAVPASGGTANAALAASWGVAVLALAEVANPVPLARAWAQVRAMAAAAGAPAPAALVAAGYGIAVWAVLQLGCLGAGWRIAGWFGARSFAGGRNSGGRVRDPSGLAAVTALLAGWLGAALALLGVGVLGLFRPGVLAGLAVAGFGAAIPARGIVAGWARGWSAAAPVPVHRVAGSAETRRVASTQAIRWISGLVLAAAGICLLAPETHIDVLTYHLGIAGRAVRTGKLFAPSGNFLHHFPLVTELLRGWGLALGGEAAARLWTLGGLAAGAAAVRAAVLPVAGSAWAWVGLGLWVTCPLAADMTLVGKPDSVVAPAAVAAVAWLVRGGSAGALVAGLMVGLAAGAKLTALSLVPVAVLLAAAPRGSGFRRDPGGRLRPSAVALVLAGIAAAAGPWFVKSALLTGDPVYPFGRTGYGIMPAAVAQLAEVTNTMTVRGRYGGLLGRIASPWTATMADGLPAVWLALVPLALLAGGIRTAPRWWFAGAALWVQWAAGPPQLRYAMPALACLTVAVAGSLAGARRARVLVMAVLVLQFVRTMAGFAADGSGAAGLGLEDRDAFRRRMLTTYAETVDLLAGLPAGSRVVLAGEWRQWPASRFLIVPSLHEPFAFLPAVRASAGTAGVARRIRQMAPTHVVHNPAAAMYTRHSQTINLWTVRDVIVWADWWRRHAVLVAPPSRVDPAQGGYFLYRLGPAHAPAPTPSLPGMEGIMAVVESHLRRRDLATAGEAVWMLESVVGDFPQVQAFLGQVWYADDPSVAAAYVRRAYAGGWLDLAGGRPAGVPKTAGNPGKSRTPGH